MNDQSLQSDQHIAEPQYAEAGTPSVRLTPHQIKQWRWASTRLLVLLWCMYLFGVWLLSLQADSPTPASHWMIWCMMVGMLIIWPALTLSQTRYIVRKHHHEPNPDGLPGMPIPVPMRTWVVFVQWLCLGLVNQSVLWPLQITAGWATYQTMWINAALLSWSLLIGLFIAVGKRSFSSVHRTLAMLICVGLVFGEPLLQAMLNTSWHMMISPLNTVHQLLLGHITNSVTSHITGVALAACVGWGVLGIIQAARVEN